MSRGVRTSVLPGGQGFECPPNYGMFFDTAAEALNHAAVGRVYDDEGRTPCLWAGCGRMFSSTQVHHGKWLNGNDLKKLLQHEKQHVKGDPAAFTGFRCPEAGCTFSDPTSAAVWAHAAEAHGSEHERGRCLWAECGLHFRDGIEPTWNPPDVRVHNMLGIRNQGYNVGACPDALHVRTRHGNRPD